MREVVTFVLGAIVFFIVGVWFAFLDELFQDLFTDNENTGRGFWITIALTAFAAAAIAIIYYVFIENSEDGTEAKQQFINIHSHPTRELNLPSLGRIDIGSIEFSGAV